VCPIGSLGWGVVERKTILERYKQERMMDETGRKGRVFIFFVSGDYSVGSCEQFKLVFADEAGIFD